MNSSDQGGPRTFTDPRQLAGTDLARRPFLRRLVGSGAAVTVGSTLAGCTGDDDGETPEELVVARAGDADNLDPHVTTQIYSAYVMSLIYDPLMVLDFDNEPSPAIGQGWEVSDDGTEWSIELNEGIEFHNGDPLTADDVVFTYNRLMEESVIPWTVGSLTEVEAVDETNVTFHFEEPYAPWEIHTTTPYFGIIPRGPVEEDPEGFGTDPVGTGPYQLGEWALDDRMVLERNDDWNTPTYPEVESEDPPNPERIVIRVIPEDTPRVQELETGGIDMIIDDLPPREVDDLEDDGDVEVESYLTNTYHLVNINNDLAPTDEVEVRQAMAHAIDRQQIIDDIHHGLAESNPAPLSENVLGWAGEEIREQGLDYEYDPDRAREILEDAGWEDTGGDERERDGEPLHIDMVTPNAPSAAQQTSEEIMAKLSEVGFSVELTAYEPSTASVEMGEGNYHVHGFSSLGWMDPSVMTFQFHSDYVPVSNTGRVADDEIDEKIEQGSAALDPEERAEYYRDAQIRAMELAACIPLMTAMDSVAYQSDISGFKIQPHLLTHIFHDVVRE